MSKRDYYQVLGLATDCTPQDIKRNYRKLALVWHPDKNANKCEAENKFTEIHEAYTILVDTNKRKEYDLYGHKDDGKDHCFGRDFFTQKGFNGTDKSAFDVLQEIFDDNDEEENADDFFGSFTTFGKISDAFRSNLKSFIHDNIMSSENEEADGFFESYTPTFMDTSFFNIPSLFKAQSDSDTQNTEFFSFFSSVDSNTHSFSKSSTTFVHKGKVKTSTKQRVQKGKNIFEDIETQEYDLEDSPKTGKNLKSKSIPKSAGTKKSKEVITIDDDNEEEEDDKPRRSVLAGKSKSSPLKKNKTHQSKRCELLNKSSKRDGLAFCMDDLINSEFGLFEEGDFDFFTEDL